MTLMKRLGAGSALGALAFALAAPAAYAQQTTASVSGVVQDVGGKPLAGATVTVTHTPSKSQIVTQTNDAGGFDVRGLRVGGPYVVAAVKGGYQAQTIADLNLAVGDAQRLTLSLAPEGAVGEVVVTATRATTAQIANVGSKTVLRREAIESVVSVKRDIRDLGRRDPLAQLDFVGRSTGPSGGLYIAGSLPRANRITIDGVRSSDSYGLNTGGLSTNRGPVSFEAIEQFSIQAAPFDVEDGDFTGGALNIITRSGTNDFHGSIFGLKRETKWAGNQLPVIGYTGGDITKPLAPSFTQVNNTISEQNFGGSLSGPLIKDKLFFAASYEKYSTVTPITLGPFGSGFANTYAAIPGVSSGNGASQADIDKVFSNWNSYAASKALPIGSIPNSEPLLDEKVSLKFDYNIMEGQRATVSFRHASSSVWKPNTSVGFIATDTAWYVQPETEDNYAIQLNSRWSDRLSTEVRATERLYERGQLPPEGQGFPQLVICGDVLSGGATQTCTGGVPQLEFGPDQFRQANVLKTKEWSGEFIANYRAADTHLVKLGYQFRGVDIYNLFLQQAAGVYYFDSVADFASGKANQLAIGGSLDGVAKDAAAKPAYQVHTLLAQDTWNVTPDLTLNYGLRFDDYVSSRHPTLNTNFVGRYGFANTKDYNGLSVLMPRFTAKYHTSWADFAGGVGLLSGGVSDVVLANSYGATTGALTNAVTVRRQLDGSFIDANTNTPIAAAIGQALLNINKADPNVVSSPPALVQSLLTADSVARRTAFTNSLAPNFKMPSDWKANFSIKSSRWGFNFGIDGVISQSSVNIAFRDIRSRLLTVNGVQQYTPDGRLRYDGLAIAGATPALVNAARAAAGLPVASNPDLANLGINGDIQAYNPSEQNWSRTVAFSVGRQWKGFDVFLAYTLQDGQQYGGISEFATTAGGNTASGALYPDQSFALDPNGAAKGRSNNLITSAVKLNVSYKFEARPGWTSRFTLFGEDHAGRPISFLMSDPAGGRNPTFGVSRDDALVYIPNLASPDPTNPLKFTSNGTTVIFDSAASVTKLQTLVTKFGLPMGRIVPRGFGKNPEVNRLDFQYAQDIPTPIKGHQMLFTVDIANLANLLNKHWGVVKEYSNSRAGGLVVNAQCANDLGVQQGTGSAICSTYRYSYTSVNPTTLATPTIDQQASLWALEIGLKYRF
jgi:hypothetical protein